MTTHRQFRQTIVETFHKDSNFKTNILSKIKDNRFYITFNRPKRYNAFSPDMYYTFWHLIIAANQNPDVNFIIVSGAGANFSSGNDLSNFTDPTYTNLGSTQLLSKQTANILQELCATIIKSQKPIFAIVEGKAIGFAFTQLALYDRVFAVQTAEFNAPLVQIAQGPEMCASYTFPKIFGRKIAQDLVIKGQKVNAVFLQKYEFLTSAKSRQEAQQKLDNHLKDLQNLQWTSYLKARQIFKERDVEILLKVNHRECVNLVERWLNPNLAAHLIKYMAKAKKKAKL